MKEPDYTPGLGSPVRDERPSLLVPGFSWIFVLNGGGGTTQRNGHVPDFSKDTREIVKYGRLSLLTGVMPRETPSPRGVCSYYSDHLSQGGMRYGKSGYRHGLELAKAGDKCCHFLLARDLLLASSEPVSSCLSNNYFIKLSQRLNEKMSLRVLIYWWP